MLITVAAPNALTVVAIVFIKLNVVLVVVALVVIDGFAIVGVVPNTRPPLPVEPVEVVPSTTKCPAIVVVPPAKPMFIAVAAPPIFKVVVVALNKLTVVELDDNVLPAMDKLPPELIAANCDRTVSALL
jgi:hypothetical protein